MVFSDSPFMPADALLWGFFLYLMFYIGLNLSAFRNLVTQLPGFHWFASVDFDIDVRENLDIYWKCLDDFDKDGSILEEYNNRQNLKLTMMLERSLKQIQSNPKGRMTLQNIHTYDMLFDQGYFWQFRYVSNQAPMRHKIINDGKKYDENSEFDSVYQSDLVRLVLSLAFMNEKDLYEF